MCIQGKTKTIKNGEKFKSIYNLFCEKFKWVQDNPWQENEVSFLKIIPTSKTNWKLESN